jgi:hypothetical protein
MPLKGPTFRPSIYVGVDPGAKGGIAVLIEGAVAMHKMPETDGDLWKIFRELDLEARPMYHSHRRIFCVVERIDPRPTGWVDKASGGWKSSILRSTCLLYGSFCTVTALLLAAGIPQEVVAPREWQKKLGLRGKKKGETASQWKNYLKAQAQALFPTEQVTLQTADALLLADYCRRKQEGKL